MTPVEKYRDLCNRLHWHLDARPSYRRALVIRSIKKEIDNLIREFPNLLNHIDLTIRT